MVKSLKKQQIPLLRFEKLLMREAAEIRDGKGLDRVAVAGGLGAVALASFTTAVKLGSFEPIAHTGKAALTFVANAGDGKAMLTAMAEVASAGHAAVERLASEGGWAFLQVGGGTDKPERVTRIIQSTLGM